MNPECLISSLPRPSLLENIFPFDRLLILLFSEWAQTRVGIIIPTGLLARTEKESMGRGSGGGGQGARLLFSSLSTGVGDGVL